jgi:hypothetical protein
MSDVYFYIGRLSYLILYFDPMVDAGFTEAPSTIEEILLSQRLSQQGGAPNIFTMIYDASYSFLNASIGAVSPNTSVCVGNLTYLNDSFNLLVT